MLPFSLLLDFRWCVLWCYSVAAEIEDADLVKSLLQDLEKIRMDRIKIGLHQLAVSSKDESVKAVKVE